MTTRNGIMDRMLFKSLDADEMSRLMVNIDGCAVEEEDQGGVDESNEEGNVSPENRRRSPHTSVSSENEPEHERSRGEPDFVPTAVGSPPPSPPQQQPKHSAEEDQNTNRAPAVRNYSRVPCKARGVKGVHVARNAFIEIPDNVQHGTVLACCQPECRASGRRFR